jgi:hypothetical protein
MVGAAAAIAVAAIVAQLLKKSSPFTDLED